MLSDMPDTSSLTQPTQSAKVAKQAPAGLGNVVLSKTANRPGVPLQKPVLKFLGELAGRAKRTIVVGTGSNHNKMTTTGNVSDHWVGNAGDLEVGGDARQSNTVGHRGDLIAAHAIQLASGSSFKQAYAMARKGGVWSFQTPLGRVQILWKTMVGGNHYNHVHVGVKPG